MSKIPQDYLQKVYAGWLGKVIGIRHGAPIEGWTYETIGRVLGEIDGYPLDYRPAFAADDDSNGPLFFLRALELAKDPQNLEPQDVAQALLNYAPYEHGFFWWGGYGVSTEHTAYLNLRAGVPAPRSGSIAQNGAAVAEQIGGQIFIDTWGLVSPGNPEQAARLARAAASVMHDGNAVYGGVYVAVCISLAFVRDRIGEILAEALRFIPEDCEYARAVRAVMDFHAAHADEGWRACFRFVHDHFGYDRYPGACHIIPNAAVMILAMLYGDGDFVRTINICNMCGWDTDCNVGNVATILGVLTGLQGVDEEKWIRPVNDLLVCSSVVGSLNAMDVPYGAAYIARWAYRLANEPMPEPMAGILARAIDGCHFEFERSTHAIRARGAGEVYLRNTGEQAHTGRRSLKASAPNRRPGDAIFLGKRTYYGPEDFYDSRYDPNFSPLVYPGQTVHASVRLAEGSCPLRACLYARDAHGGEIALSDAVALESGRWHELALRIPPADGALIDEIGIRLEAAGLDGGLMSAYLDDLYFDGAPDYAVDLSRERTEVWSQSHRGVSQFTRLKGLMYLEDGELHLTGADFAEAYTGRHDWTDYAARFVLSVQQPGAHACANFRVQGAMRSYAAGFIGENAFAIAKNEGGAYRVLCQAPFEWKPGEVYEIDVSAKGGQLAAECRGVRLECWDGDYPTGSVGLSARGGAHVRLSRIEVHGK